MEHARVRAPQHYFSLDMLEGLPENEQPEQQTESSSFEGSMSEGESERDEEEEQQQGPTGPSVFPPKGRNFIEKPVPRATWKRLRAAQQAIDHVNNKVLPFGSGNQVDDVARSHGVAQARAFQTVNRFSPDHWVDKDAGDTDVGRVAAQQSILADHYHAGVCDTYSYATFNHLRKIAKGQQITRAGMDCGDHGGHAFNVIGDLQNDAASELVVADPWATAPQPVLLEDFFLGNDTTNLRPKETMRADGVDGMKKYKSSVQFKTPLQDPKQIAADDHALDHIPQGIKDEQYRNTSVVDPKYAAPIFYYNQDWSKRKVEQRRKRFEKQLETNKHLGPKALKQLGIKETKEQ